MTTILGRARAWAIRIAATVALVIVLLPVGGALNAVRALPDLQPWHELHSRLEENDLSEAGAVYRREPGRRSARSHPAFKR